MEDDSGRFVKLISAEGNEFLVEKIVAANGSEMLKSMLEGNFRESEHNVVRFPEISSRVLEKLIEYLYYKSKYEQSTDKIPEFQIEPEMSLELLVAANYLNC